MPLKKCQENGKSGWKFGDSGKCYTGPDGKKKAIKQGLQIAPEEFKGKSLLEIADMNYEEKRKSI